MRDTTNPTTDDAPRVTCLTCGRELTPGGPVCCPKPTTTEEAPR